MSLIRRLAAAAAAAALLTLFAASCHKKDEIALKIGDIQIKGALYQAYLIQADGEARQKLTSDSTSSGSTSSISNFSKESVEGKSFGAWVRDRALELCRQHAIVDTLFNKYKLKLTQEEIDNMNYMIQMYDQYYGTLTVFTDNGVSLATYTEVMKTSYKSAAIFKYYYDAGGTKAVAEKDKKEALEKLYVLANTIEIKFTTTDASQQQTTMTTEEQDAAKALLEGYMSRIKKGESFAAIKKEYDKKKADEEAAKSGSSAVSSEVSSAPASSAADSSDAVSSGEPEPKPLDENATTYGSAEASSPAADRFEKIKEIKLGDVSVIKFDDAYMLAVRKDVLADPYYLTTYNSETLSFLKGDEFEKELKSEGDKLSLEEHKFVTNYYTPKKIKYPEQ